MRRGLILLAVLLLPIVGLAQPTPQVYWEHDGLNVTRFECVVDSTTTSDLGLPTPSGATYSTAITNCSGVMVAGTHTLVIRACNGAGCASAASITVVKL